MSHRLLMGAVAAAFVATACGGGISSPTASPSRPTTQISPTLAAISATPSPAVTTTTPIPSLATADLPPVELAGVDATGICDPDPSQADVSFGESTISCPDGLATALAVIRLTNKDPVTRMYLDRPACASSPCTESELSTAQVTVWTMTAVIAVQLDSRLQTVTPPSGTTDVGWPTSSGRPPTVARPSIEDAPGEVARRDAYPFCGHAEIGEPSTVLGCFRDAVLAGRPAEMIEKVYGTEGGEILWIYRYAGHGRLIRYEHDQAANGVGQFADAWERAEGAMILGITPQSWDFDPWFRTALKP